MKRQRNMDQIKKQVKTPEKGLNEMKISNISHAEFKTLVIRIFKELSEDLNSIKKIQSETKHPLIEIKNNLQGNNSSVNTAESQINGLECKESKTTNQNDKKKIESKKIEVSIRSLQILELQAYQHLPHRVVGRRREGAKNWKLISKIMKENFPNLLKEIDMRVQEAQRVPTKMDVKRPTPRHIIFKILMVKDRES